MAQFLGTLFAFLVLLLQETVAVRIDADGEGRIVFAAAPQFAAGTVLGTAFRRIRIGVRTIHVARVLLEVEDGLAGFLDRGDFFGQGLLFRFYAGGLQLVIMLGLEADVFPLGFSVRVEGALLSNLNVELGAVAVYAPDRFCFP